MSVTEALKHSNRFKSAFEVQMNLPCSTHSLGGRIAFRMSSCFGLFSIGGNWLFPFLLEAGNNNRLAMWASGKDETVSFYAHKDWNDLLTSKGLLEWVVGVNATSDLHEYSWLENKTTNSDMVAKGTRKKLTIESSSMQIKTCNVPQWGCRKARDFHGVCLQSS